MELGVGLLDQRNPELILIAAASEADRRRIAVPLETRNPVIDDDVSPLIVLIESDNVHTVLPQVMEYRTIDASDHPLDVIRSDVLRGSICWVKTSSDSLVI